MADEETTILAGAVDPGALRRIGFAHAVVLLPRQAKLIDIGGLRLQRDQVDRRTLQLQTELRSLEAQRAELSANITSFENQPIERVEGDPDVPLTDPSVVPPDKPEPAPGEVATPATRAKPTR